MRSSRERSMPLADLDRFDLVANLDRGDDVHAGRHQTEVGVLLVEERRRLFHDKELAVVVERRVLTARDPYRTESEGQVVVLARHALAARTGPSRIAAL